MSATLVDRSDAVDELRKFFTLSSELGPGLTMFSEFVDAQWHSLLGDPDSYEAFCQDLGVDAFGHVPSGDVNPIVVVEWIDEYESRWGDLPLVWFADEGGVTDEDAYADYLDTHTVVAAWRCSPSTGSVARAVLPA